MKNFSSENASFPPDTHNFSSIHRKAFLTLVLGSICPLMFEMRRVLQAERPSWERWRRVYMRNRAGKADNMLRSVFHCTLMCFRREVDECVLNLGDCSLNEHLSLPACLARASFSLELPKGEVYIWQNEKESQAHPFLLRGMKKLRSFRVTAQSEHLSFL